MQLFLTSEVNAVAQDIRNKITINKSNLKTAFITTPLEKGHEDDDLQWSKDNQTALQSAGFDTFEYSITNKNTDQLKADLQNCDVIYVEGGSLVHMMNQTRISGFDIFIREFLQNGGIYIGTSTGSFIAASDTAPGLALEFYLEDNFNSAGIGLVNFLVMPHWGTDTFKTYYDTLVSHAYNMKTPMIILNDRQYVWVRGECVQIIDLNIKN